MTTITTKYDIGQTVFRKWSQRKTSRCECCNAVICLQEIEEIEEPFIIASIFFDGEIYYEDKHTVLMAEKDLYTK